MVVSLLELASKLPLGLFLGVIGDHDRKYTIALEDKGQGLMHLPFALHWVSTCPTKRCGISLGHLLPHHDMDPVNIVSLNMVYSTRLYLSVWLLVGNCHDRVGFKHVCTLLCVVITTVRFACSGDIIHWAAKVWGSMGAILRNQMCSLRLVSMLEIWT